MENSRQISELVIKRLPRYYRFLGELLRTGIKRISSRELAARMGLTASQIRQDFNCFGGFGQQGYGYNVAQLHEEIGHILGLDKKQKAILIGVGNLGRAISNHVKFEQLGFQLIGIFDRNEALNGEIIRNIPVRNTSVMDEFCRENLPAVAILCIPKESALPIAEQLIKLGVRGFWNFSHADIAVSHPEVSVENVHFHDSLMTLRYKIND